MVTPLLRELAGPLPPFFRFEEPWFVHDRNAQRLRQAWDSACDQVTRTGDTEELHSARDGYQIVLLGHLKILDGYLLLLQHYEGERPDTAFESLVRRTRDDLQKHYDSLFPRWQTIDDLEAILLERVSPPNERLKALAANNSPPQAWFDEVPDALTTPE